jgi:hypothetical protein
MTPDRGESVISRANDQAVWPWQAEPYRLWSLLDMVERFSLNTFGAFLVDFERATAGLEMILAPPQSEAECQSFLRQAISSFQLTLSGVVDACVRGNAPLSYAVRMQIQDFQTRATQRHSPSAVPALLEHARLTRQAVLNDLAVHLFLSVDSESATFYLKPLLGWDAAIARFGCSFDIEEGRKCFALGRHTAAVFHLMKVVEAAVLELQIFLKDADVKAHFGSVLTKLEQMTQQNRYEHVPTDLRPYLQFMREVLTQLHAVKDSWRNKVAHVDAFIIPTETFTPELAKSVHDATLALMNKLANGMPPKA